MAGSEAMMKSPRRSLALCAALAAAGVCGVAWAADNDVALVMRNGEVVRGKLVTFVGGVFEIEIPSPRKGSRRPSARVEARAEDVREVYFVDRASPPPPAADRGRRSRSYRLSMKRPDIPRPKTKNPWQLRRELAEVAREAIDGQYLTRDDIQQAYERVATMVGIAQALRQPDAVRSTLERVAGEKGRSPRINTIVSVLSVMSFELQNRKRDAVSLWDEIESQPDVDRKIVALVESVIEQGPQAHRDR